MFRNLFEMNIHFTRQAHYFHFMRGNNKFIYRSFVFQSVVIWNKLIQNINTCASYPRLKKYIYISYYLIMLPLDIMIYFARIILDHLTPLYNYNFSYMFC